MTTVRAPESPARAVACERLLAAPRVTLGSWPTPLERLCAPAAAGLWVKRDDLSGWGRGGAKARKLEHIVGHLRAEGYTDVVTVTGNVTNLVFDVLPALDACGLGSHILVVDYPAARRAAREAIFAGVRERVELLGGDCVGALARALAVWGRARLAGRRPFLLLPGAAHPASVIGNACGLLELAGQLGAGARDAAAVVFVTVATGTTFAGFLLGAHALAAAGGPRLRVIGVAVDGAPVVPFTLGLIRWAERRLRLPALVPARHVEILSAHRGIPFARVTPDAEDACRRVERAFGLRLDPIFGGKTWCAMERCLAARPELREHPAVYWHCGYTPEWRALCSALRPGRSAA